jgi:hypothetical protein
MRTKSFNSTDRDGHLAEAAEGRPARIARQGRPQAENAITLYLTLPSVTRRHHMHLTAVMSCGHLKITFFDKLRTRSFCRSRGLPFEISRKNKSTSLLRINNFSYTILESGGTRSLCRSRCSSRGSGASLGSRPGCRTRTRTSCGTRATWSAGPTRTPRSPNGGWSTTRPRKPSREHRRRRCRPIGENSLRIVLGQSRRPHTSGSKRRDSAWLVGCGMAQERPLESEGTRDP